MSPPSAEGFLLRCSTFAFGGVGPGALDVTGPTDTKMMESLKDFRNFGSSFSKELLRR